MKIAFIDVTATVSFGGVQTAIWQLAIALTDLGHQVFIHGGDGSARGDLAGRMVTVYTHPFTDRAKFPNLGTRFRKLAERLSFARSARSGVIAGDYDWVVLTKPLDFFWPRLMPTGNRSRFVFMSGGTDFFRGDRWLSGRISAMVACSNFTAQQSYSRFKRRVDVMFNGVDVARFSPEMRNEAQRIALGFTQKDVVFVFAGRIVGLKGLHIVIEALAHPVLDGVAARLLIIGSGDALPRLQHLARCLDVDERVVFHPAVSHKDLPTLVASADVGIFPSLGEEAFGISVAEAMACGLPVVTSYNGGMPEVVGNEGSCGVLFALGDVAGCAAAIEKISRSSELRASMGMAARRRIETMFTWQQAAQRLLGALSAVESV